MGLTDNWQIAEILTDNWHLYPPPPHLYPSRPSIKFEPKICIRSLLGSEYMMFQMATVFVMERVHNYHFTAANLIHVINYFKSRYTRKSLTEGNLNFDDQCVVL